MPPGTYAGNVHVLMSGFTPPATVVEYHVFHLPVQLTVNAAPSGSPVATPAALEFTYTAFGTLPGAQSISVAMDKGIALGFTAAATTDTGN